MSYRKQSKYTKKQISKAWFELANWKIDDSYLDVVNEFRYSHEVPTKKLLALISKNDLIKLSSRRLKRTPAIVHKIKRSIDVWNKTQLSRMQDVWGCRWILDSVTDINTLYDSILEYWIDWFIVKRHVNYISAPKKDWYRWVHIIFECSDWSSFDWLMVELQLRTKLQHSRSTAIEIIDSINETKMKFWEWDSDFKKFFKWISVLFEWKEWIRRSSRNKAKRNALKLQKGLNVLWQLQIRTLSYDFVRRYQTKSWKKNIKWDIILQLTRDNKNINIKPYHWKTTEELKELYLELEKLYIRSNNIDIVYLSSEEIDTAYPNYVWDAKIFIKECHELLN